MEKKIYRNINDREFFDILANTDEVNKTILLNLYSSLIEFINLSNKEDFNGSLEQLLIKKESEFYIINDKSLTDKEIIDYELKRINEEYKKQIEKNISGVNSSLDSQLQQQLLVLVEFELGKIKIFKEVLESSITQDDILFIKKTVAYIEAMLKMDNGLYYEGYLKFCEELELRINNLKDTLYNNKGNKIK